MNALSSIRQIVTPEMQPLPLPRSGGPSPIPLNELQEIPSAFTPPPAAPGSASASSFDNVLGHLVSEVSAKQSAAGDAVGALLSGQNVSLHQAMIAMEEASVSFQLMVEVRNKLLESYQELMRMQV